MPASEFAAWFSSDASLPYNDIQIHGLPVTGELDRRTWQHMVRLYAQTVGDGTGSYPVRIAHPEETQTPQRV